MVEILDFIMDKNLESRIVEEKNRYNKAMDKLYKKSGLDKLRHLDSRNQEIMARNGKKLKRLRSNLYDMINSTCSRKRLVVGEIGTIRDNSIYRYNESVTLSINWIFEEESLSKFKSNLENHNTSEKKLEILKELIEDIKKEKRSILNTVEGIYKPIQIGEELYLVYTPGYIYPIETDNKNEAISTAHKKNTYFAADIFPEIKEENKGEWINLIRYSDNIEKSAEEVNRNLKRTTKEIDWVAERVSKAQNKECFQ